MSKKDKEMQDVKNKNSHDGSEIGMETAEEQMDTKGVDVRSSQGGSKGNAEAVQEPVERQGQGLDSRIEELTGDLQRLQAEFTNYRRREGEAKAHIAEIVKEDVLKQILPLLDNIERAFAHRPDELKNNAWATGVEAVGKQTGETLKKLGVTRISSLGQPFDHDLHEAIGYEDGDGDVEVVTEELQPGYRLGDKVIRHAVVKVGKK